MRCNLTPSIPSHNSQMKALLLFLSLIAGINLAAQSSALRVEPANVVKEVVVDDLDDAYQDITSVTVTNTSRREIQLVQRTSVKGAPRSWNYGVFSRRNHTAPYPMNEADLDEGRPVRLGNGQSASFAVVLAPEGISGEGTVEVFFSDLNFPGKVIATAAFSTKILRRPQVDATNPPDLGTDSPAPPPPNTRPTPTTVRLYPNPTRDNKFFVEAPPGTKIGRIEVANTLGNRLRKFNQTSRDGYDVEGLPDGLYLVYIYDENGKKLKTLRLLHRRFGA